MPTRKVRRPGRNCLYCRQKNRIWCFFLLYRSLNNGRLVEINVFTLVVALKLSWGREISFLLGHMHTRSVKYQERNCLCCQQKNWCFMLTVQTLNDCEPVHIHAFTLVVAIKLSYGRKISFQLRHMPTRTVKRQCKKLSLLPM